MIRQLSLALLLVLTLLTALGRSAAAQESRVWIEGTSSVNSFTCTTDDVEGSGLLSGSNTTAIKVPVATLDCGNSRMNKDLRAALDADEHPHIRFDVARISVEQRGSDGLSVEASGILTIAGTGQSVTITLEGQRRADDHIRITGSTALKLSSFGIDPPTALLGLIKVHDRVEVHFDLIEPAADRLAFRGAE